MCLCVGHYHAVDDVPRHRTVGVVESWVQNVRCGTHDESEAVVRTERSEVHRKKYMYKMDIEESKAVIE